MIGVCAHKDALPENRRRVEYLVAVYNSEIQNTGTISPFGTLRRSGQIRCSLSHL